MYVTFSFVMSMQISLQYCSVRSIMSAVSSHAYTSSRARQWSMNAGWKDFVNYVKD